MSSSAAGLGDGGHADSIGFYSCAKGLDLPAQ